MRNLILIAIILVSLMFACRTERVPDPLATKIENPKNHFFKRLLSRTIKQPTKNVQVDRKYMKGKTTLTEIYSKPKKYNGLRVQIEGYFMGWIGKGCTFLQTSPLQVNRSDWIFTDLEYRCVYVTNGKPALLSPIHEPDKGRRIVLIAVVHIYNNKDFILEYINSQVLNDTIAVNR